MKTGTTDAAALERLSDILDAYGGDPDRWPDAEREPALDLLARSADARLLRDEALRLDAALDLLPAAEPSNGLEARILAAAQQTPQDMARAASVASLDDARLRRGAARPRRGLLLAAALPLAAAAAFALWVARADRATTTQQVASAGHTAPAPHAREASEDDLRAALASYKAPDDALGELAGLDDVYGSDPWNGCSEGDLGCVKNNSLPLDPLSRGNQEIIEEARALS